MKNIFQDNKKISEIVTDLFIIVLVEDNWILISVFSTQFVIQQSVVLF